MPSLLLLTFSRCHQLLPSHHDENDEHFEAQGKAFRIMYYTIAWIQALSALIFLLTQTTCVFFYDWTVEQGFQPSQAEIGSALVQNGRAYGASDTLLYIPLLCTSSYGLFFKKRWSLICTAASAGISSYWSLTGYFLLLFASRAAQVEDFSYMPDATTWTLIVFYFLYGILVLTFLYHYWDTLYGVMGD